MVLFHLGVVRIRSEKGIVKSLWTSLRQLACKLFFAQISRFCGNICNEDWVLAHLGHKHHNHSWIKELTILSGFHPKVSLLVSSTHPIWFNGKSTDSLYFPWLWEGLRVKLVVFQFQENNYLILAFCIMEFSISS